MEAIETILFPTDFSEASARAFDVASALAKQHGARLLILHVLTPPPFVTYGELGRAMQGSSPFRQAMEARLRQLWPGDPLIRVQHELVDGDPVTEILRKAGGMERGLIVMGTAGRAGIPRLLMGSVAESILRRAPCPVLLVKREDEKLAASRHTAAETFLRATDVR